MTDDYDFSGDDSGREADFMKKIIEALFKGMVSGLSEFSGDGVDTELSSNTEIKIPLFEAIQEGKKFTLLVEMPGAIEEDIVVSIENDTITNKFLRISTVDSLGTKYKADISLPAIIKKVKKDHFTNGVLELILS